VKTNYTVLVDSRVIRELRQVPRKNVERILDAIDALGADPRPRGAKKLVDQPGWRIRIGDYRILYEIDDKASSVKIYRAGHRRDVYR
jgi:mRNA interferase RelE/StbE